MASPPAGFTYNSPTAHSPPYPSHSQLPPINTMSSKKRASDGGASGPSPSLKRRKASAVSIASGVGGGSAHPLRQTSFPPDDVGTPFTARSPSVDIDNVSFVSGSQVSAAGPPKKKRGRKSKAEKAREQTPSVVAGRGTVAGSDVGGKAGAKSTAGGEDGADAAEDDGPTEVAVSGSFSKEQREEEHRRKNVLVGALAQHQFQRFEHYRAAGLTKSIIRRVINQAISQSVSDNIVIGTRALTKLHLGMIIESARRIQVEWIAKTGERQTDLEPLPTPPPDANASPAGTNVTPGLSTPTLNGTNTQTSTTTTTNGEPNGASQVEANKEQGSTDSSGAAPRKPTQEEPGPLRPEHLREAVRRFKSSWEAGGVGLNQTFYMQQQAGIERFPSRTGGRRIFR